MKRVDSLSRRTPQDSQLKMKNKKLEYIKKLSTAADSEQSDKLQTANNINSKCLVRLTLADFR